MSPGKIGAVMVIGGGVAGIQASLDLAESGFYVYLVERSPAIGGVMAQLDKTFPTNDCSMCILSPKLVECGRHNNIRLLTNATVTGLDGGAGDFTVTLKKEPRYVDPEKCVGCGVCSQKCPVKVPDAFNENLGFRKAIYSKYAQAVPNTYTIDPGHCIFLTRGKTPGGKDRCKACEKFCPTGAVDFEQEVTFEEVRVGAIIASTGYKLYDPGQLTYYGYGKNKHVITSMEFERILSASGPYGGRLVRPEDGSEPKRIAWVQCVGSRNLTEKGLSYCSSVCCTYAIKEAVVAKEHAPDHLDATIFYMDMRTYGKDFEIYMERAKTEYGVRLVRSRIYEVNEAENGNPLIRYSSESGEIFTEEFDLVVLSVGLLPAAGTRDLARTLGIELNNHGFSGVPGLETVKTSRSGIFACGTFCGPQDIPDTVVQASAAAGSAGALLAEARKSMVSERAFPPERDVAGLPPRVGVFVCHCGINIGSVVDVAAVKDHVSGLEGVVFADECLYACSQDNQQKIKSLIEQYHLNRVVVASCTPRTHEGLFRQTMKEAGLNPYLFEMANIREHCSWVHATEHRAATLKAMYMVSRAVAKVRLMEPLRELTMELNRSALVLGGGVAGMNAALDLADQGVQVCLLEKNHQLGGYARLINETVEGLDVKGYLQELVDRIDSHPLIEVVLGAGVTGALGHMGNFTTRVALPDGNSREINHGVTIIAIGGSESRPREYLYGEDARVMTGLELDQAITGGDARVTGARAAVLIQCVGSRNEERPYCSRVCCSQSVKNALELKKLNPEMQVFVLYRDMRTFGLREDYFTQARQKGIIFIRYNREKKPEVELLEQDGQKILRVTVIDHVLQAPLVIDADLLALAAAIDPPGDGSEIYQHFKVPRNSDGFFLEAHVKLRPVDFTSLGIFLCGLAYGPKFLQGSIAQGKAAAARAMTVLSKNNMITGGEVSVIDESRCSGCRVCIGVCPYNAITCDEIKKVARSNPFLCQGCGTCAAACPSGACTAKNFGDEHISAEIEALCG